MGTQNWCRVPFPSIDMASSFEDSQSESEWNRELATPCLLQCCQFHHPLLTVYSDSQALLLDRHKWTQGTSCKSMAELHSTEQPLGKEAIRFSLLGRKSSSVLYPMPCKSSVQRIWILQKQNVRLSYLAHLPISSPNRKGM